MALPLNRKLLCFIDEGGIAGSPGFRLGAVLVPAREAGRLDKCFSDLLEPTANEIHAAAMDDGYLQGLLQRFWAAAPQDRLVMVNQNGPIQGGAAPELYAAAVIQTVKASLLRFQRQVLRRDRIGNVELILDRNHHNSHALFDAAMARAQQQDGRFRAVAHIVRLDSAASRLLQLADLVAYARKWLDQAEVNAATLRHRFGIQMP